MNIYGKIRYPKLIKKNEILSQRGGGIRLSPPLPFPTPPSPQTNTHIRTHSESAPGFRSTLSCWNMVYTFYHSVSSFQAHHFIIQMGLFSFLNEQARDKTYNKTYVNSKDSDQPVHPPSMAMVLSSLFG